MRSTAESTPSKGRAHGRSMLAINCRLGFGSPIEHRTYRFELAQLRPAR